MDGNKDERRQRFARYAVGHRSDAEPSRPATRRSRTRNFETGGPRADSRSSSRGRYNLQDQFLAELASKQTHCDIMLRNEASLRGKIIDYDNWSLLVQKEEKSYLIFKSGIMALIPLEDVVYEPGGPRQDVMWAAEPEPGGTYRYKQ